MRPGLLNVGKPEGITSRRVVDRVEACVRPLRAGHAGTLDPMATGVLVVCVGQATRLIPFVQKQRKTYRAEFLLGVRSDTDDTTGAVVETEGCRPIAREEIDREVGRLIGRIEQRPPRFSAVHVEGKRAYDLARRGEAVELRPRIVEVHRIDVLSYEWPRLEAEIECGSGTYIRSIGRDLGEALGCGGAMSRLMRTRIGPFAIEDATPFDALDAGRVAAELWPMLAAVEGMPRRACGPEEVAALRQGRAIRDAGGLVGGDGLVACVADGELAAIAACLAGRGVLQPKHVFGD